MAPKTYSLPVKVPHLLRDVGNMKLETIVLPKAFKVDLTVGITTKNGEKPAGTVIKRLGDVANKVLEVYEEKIKTEAKVLDKKITNLMNDHTEANQKKAKQMISNTNMSVNNALNTVGKAVEVAVIAANKRENKAIKLLQESKIIVAVKVAKSGFDLGSSIVQLVASHGTAVLSYKKAFASIFKICEQINNHLKTQEKRQTDFDNSVKTFTKNPNVSTAGKVEECRIRYRDSCTVTMKKADELSKKAETMMQLANKGGGSFAQEISLVTECLKMKKAASEMNKKYKNVFAHLIKVQKIMKDNDLTVQDKTLYQRLISIERPSLKEMLQTAKSIEKLV